MTEPKPVKAWAVVHEKAPRISLLGLHFRQAQAERAAKHATEKLGFPSRIIPVTITPGHEAEDD